MSDYTTSVPGEARDRFPAGRGGGGSGGGPGGVGAAAGRTGRPPKTNRGELLAAARAHGFVDLTVQVMTDAVGVKYSTFYRHFDSFDQLLAVLVDDALDRSPGPLPALDTEWRAHLLGAATTLQHLMRSAPGLSQALARLPQAPARLREVRVRAIEVLDVAGFTAADIGVGVDSVLAAACADPRRAHPHAVMLLLDGLEARLHVGEHVVDGLEAGRG